MASGVAEAATPPQNWWAAAADWARAHRWALAVACLTLLAFALRVGDIGQSFYGDEHFTYDDVVGRRLGESLSRVREYEDTPPFFFLVAWFAAKVGDPLIWLRIPSLVAGTALIPLSYALGARTVGRVAALLGAGLLALSPFAVHFSTEARAYSLLLFLLVASTFALVRALEEPERRLWWVAFWLATGLALYTHYSGFFLVVGQAAWAFGFHRRQWRRLLLAYGLVVVAIAPWMLTRPESHAAAFEALYPFTLERSLKFWGQSLVGTPQIGIEDEPGALGWWLIAAAGAGCLLGLVLRARRLGRPSSGLVLLVLTGFAAPVGLILYSLTSSSVVAGRNMFASAPFMFLLVGAVLDRVGRAFTLVATALLVAALVAGLVIAAEPRWQRPAWNDVASYIEDHAAPDEPIVIGSQGGAPGTGDRDLFLQSLSVYMEGANVVGLAVDDRKGFRSIEPSRRVWVAVQNVIGGERPTAPDPGPGFTPLSERFYDGLNSIGVFLYRRAPSGPLVGSRLARRAGGEVLLQPGRPARQVEGGTGFLEVVAAERDRFAVAGWAVDEETGRAPRSIFLFDRGRFVGSGRPSIERPDVAKDFGQAPRSGFRVEIFTGRSESLASLERLAVVAVSGRRAWRLPPLGNVEIHR